jgi:hypothetical protein
MTGPSATRTHPNAAAALPMHDVQRRRVVDIDLTTNHQRVVAARSPTTDERGHWMRSRAPPPPTASSQLSRYSTTAAEV